MENDENDENEREGVFFSLVLFFFSPSDS